MGYRVCEEDSHIIMTRGDTAKIHVGIEYRDNGEPYVPAEGDIVRFSVKKNLTDKSPVITKDVPISSLLLTINPEDTKTLPFGVYRYDIQLIKANGDTDTFIENRAFELTWEVN